MVIGPFERPASAALPGWVLALQMSVFGAAATFLVLRRRDDSRVLVLAGVFAAIASSFARQPIAELSTTSAAGGVLSSLLYVRADAWLAYLVWAFFDQFPRSVPRQITRRLARFGRSASFLAGAVLFIANAGIVAGFAPRILSPFDAMNPYSIYWTILFALVGAAAPFAAWKARQSPEYERRRVTLFVIGLGASILPASIYVLADTLSPSFADWSSEGGALFVLPIVEFFILMGPVAIAYAVLVTRILPLRALAGQALRYSFASTVLVVATIAPVGWAVWAAYQLREERLVDLVAGWRSLAAVGAVGVAAFALAFRHRARSEIDRLFFRDAYDTRRVLLSVARRSQSVRRTQDWAAFLSKEIDDAIHLEHVSVFVVDWASSSLVDLVGHARSLPMNGRLAEALAASSDAFEVDLEALPERFTSLPLEERYWLSDGGWDLLVPVRLATGGLSAILALGPKRSALPFSKEDKELLVGVAGQAGVTLEHRLQLDSQPRVSDNRTRELPAFECELCGEVSEGDSTCAQCGSIQMPCLLPKTLLGKFRINRRLGSGGMGVVYDGTDLDLARGIAIKTLPSRSPEDSVQLRHEAKAMAAVSSPHLAVVYSVETWQGTPLLVSELMHGGTLEDRRGMPFEFEALAEFGAALSEALGQLHGGGILHRDIKPSNIGFTDDETPKLLDFGLAEFSEAPRRTPEARESFAKPSDSHRTTQLFKGVVGTPLYMSPELLAGDACDVQSDLWALALVLCESLLGRNPFERAGWEETQLAIRNGLDSDCFENTPDHPAKIRAFLLAALSRERGARPNSAAEFARLWRAACE